MKKTITIKFWKLSLIQAVVVLLALFASNIFASFEIPLGIFLIFSILGAIGFSIFGTAITAWTMESVLAGDELRNSFRALGRGSVKLSNAKRSFSPNFLFILLKDKENRSYVNIPRPFWADDPVLIKRILQQVDNN